MVHFLYLYQNTVRFRSEYLYHVYVKICEIRSSGDEMEKYDDSSTITIYHQGSTGGIHESCSAAVVYLTTESF